MGLCHQFRRRQRQPFFPSLCHPTTRRSRRSGGRVAVANAVLAQRAISPGTGSRKTAVLHSLLEESLLQDPQDNLLVTAPGSASVLRQGGSTLVAVCNKQWLRQALAPLQEAGLQIQRLLPEFTPVPAGGAAQLFC